MFRGGGGSRGGLRGVGFPVRACRGVPTRGRRARPPAAEGGSFEAVTVRPRAAPAVRRVDRPERRHRGRRLAACGARPASFEPTQLWQLRLRSGTPDKTQACLTWPSRGRPAGRPALSAETVLVLLPHLHPSPVTGPARCDGQGWACRLLYRPARWGLGDGRFAQWSAN